MELAKPTRYDDGGELGSVSARTRLAGYRRAETGRGLPFPLLPSLAQRRLTFGGISDILCIALEDVMACHLC